MKEPINLDELEAFIRSKPRSEAQKGEYLRRYEECEQVLQSAVAEHEEPARVLFLLAELAMQRRLWHEAIERWQRFLVMSEAPMPVACVRLAVAFREAGRFDDAARALEQAREHGFDDKTFRRELEHLQARIREVQESETCRRALRAIRGESGEDAVSLYRSILVSTLSEQQAEEYEPLLEQLVKLATNATVPRNWRTPKSGWYRRIREALASGKSFQQDSETGVSAIFSCGFGFSGSGAVTDFLRGQDRCELAFGRVELPWFQGRVSEGVTGARQLLSHAGVDHAVYRWHLVNFFLVCVLGLDGLLPRPTGSLRAPLARRAMLPYCLSRKADAPSLAGWANELLGSLADAGGRTDVETALREFFRKFLLMFTVPGKPVLFDNSIKAFELPLLRLVPDARAVVTRRDPRDQFVSRRRESMKNNSVSAKVFVDWYLRREAQYQSALRNIRVRSAVYEVQFENFVLEPGARRLVLETLGIAGGAERARQWFDPEKSRQNIGIHGNWPDRRDIEYIEKNLRKYLVEEAD